MTIEEQSQLLLANRELTALLEQRTKALRLLDHMNKLLIEENESLKAELHHWRTWKKAPRSVQLQ